MTPHAIEEILLRDPETPIVTSILDRYRPILDSLDSVYVFGAGRTGRTVARRLAAGGSRVIGFIDNSPAHPHVDGIPVNRLDAIADRNAVIVIGTGTAV
jgi:S-adenosylhomocysteine hydrolase